MINVCPNKIFISYSTEHNYYYKADLAFPDSWYSLKKKSLDKYVYSLDYT